jgi:hypothetical protein
LRFSRQWLWRMSSGMWRRVARVRADVSVERTASIFMVKIISELGTHYQQLANVVCCIELITIWERKQWNGTEIEDRHTIIRSSLSCLPWSISHLIASFLIWWLILHSVLQLLVTANMFLVCWLFSPWRWGWYIPPKRRILQKPHGITSQMMTFFMNKKHWLLS